MGTLVSPGVSVTVTDESFYVPAAAPTVPLIFIATADEKLQPNGITPAAGTYEYNVVRTVTSITQSTTLYGIPVFKQDYNGNPLHGDARNEQGLFCLNQFLGLGASAFVVRANVNLNDDHDAIVTRWDAKMQTASFNLQNYIAAYLDEVNTTAGAAPSDANYRTTVNRAEVEFQTKKATADLFALTTYKNAQFDFYDNNAEGGTTTAGYQVVDFAGSITAGTNASGLGAQLYTAAIAIDGTVKNLSINGTAASTFNNLVVEINNGLAGAGTATIEGGNIKITSGSVGSASTVLITDTNLFSSCTGYAQIDVAIPGALADSPIPIYGNGYTQPPTGEYLGWEGIADAWIDDHPTDDGVPAWTASEAADMLLEAADEYSMTMVFLNKTSLGANDAARRVTIVTALAAVVNGNQEIRSERFEYNLILCPGFPELATQMVALAQELGDEAFVIADVPPTLSPEDAANWGLTSDRTRANTVAYYYPGPLTTNLDGAVIYGSASAVALRTYTYSDNVSQVWFAPAGPRRGVVTGVDKMGYLTGTLSTPTTFVETNLNVGQRNNLYQFSNNINPITEIPGRGILVMGQKTSATVTSALDRVNVVRMLAYLRRSIRKAAFAYLFEPNDQITRDSLKSVVDGLLTNVMTERGLYDYATVCDASNNTGERIDNNELYLDIALKPMKAVEFIYIPIRVLNTSASLT